MSKFVVVVFPNEKRAYEGTRALGALHAEGSLTLYGMAVIAKEPGGRIAIKEAADEGPLGTAVGAIVGGLVGVIGGPVGAVAGAAGGALIGSLGDLYRYGFDEDFLRTVSGELAPGKTAIVAELSENWTAPLDARMEALDGIVLRTWRVDFEDQQVANELASRKRNFEELKAEVAQARSEAKAKLKTKFDQARSDLDRTQARAKAKLESIDNEAKAKIASLDKQLMQARADAKENINERMAALRANHERRSSKLKQAWQLTKEALAA